MVVSNSGCDGELEGSGIEGLGTRVEVSPGNRISTGVV